MSNDKDWGEEEENVEFLKWERETKLKLAKAVVYLLITLYAIISFFYVYVDTPKDLIVKDIWTHFSQFSSNAIMLILGFYFAKGKQ